MIVELLNRMPMAAIVFLCLTLGLAPYAPPHLVEKLLMLFRGRLTRPVDWFDLFLHASPWILLILKLVLSGRNGRP